MEFPFDPDLPPFRRVREMAWRVRRWRRGEMSLRWTAAGVLEAERNFRKVVGFRFLAKLHAALRAMTRRLIVGLIIENGPPK